MDIKNLSKIEYNVIINKLEDNCKTFVGKGLARDLMPFVTADKVKNALNETNTALLFYHKLGYFPINQFDDLNLTIKQLKSDISISAKQLLDIASVLENARNLREYYEDICDNKNDVANNDIDYSALDNYFNNLYSNKDIENSIKQKILSPVEIADNASSKLASLRHNRKNIEAGIKTKLNNLIHSSSFSKYIMEPVVTIRNSRYVIPVKYEYKSFVKGFVHDTSASGATIYVEPLQIFDLNNEINNLINEENKEIEVILQKLSASLFPIVNYLENDINLIGKLDFISSKVKLAVEFDCSMPSIDEFIEFKNARHPLIPKDKVVPININLGKTFNVLVITGPNTGGKTVTLKTVGLLCAMAQSGLLIPVSDGSTIKIFDNIFADIGDEQSIEESLSTFSSHITNIVNILNTFTKNSLILADELGSGTDPIEGANLAISLLEEFYNAGAFVVATTHYHEIKNYCISHKGFENASAEFDLKTLSPTYHILIGVPGKSNAFEISKKLGIPDRIINNASSLIKESDIDIENLLKQIYDSKIKIEKEKEETEKNLHQAELLRKSLEKQNDEKLINEQKKINSAKAEAREILLDAKEQANEIISQLKNKKDIKDANKMRNDLNKSINSIGSTELDFSSLLKLNNKYDDKRNEKSKYSFVHFNNNNISSISPEINVIGENGDSAIAIIDKYLDSCYVSGIHQVRIVHGKGTGKLREIIHKYLKNNKYVKDFEIAPYGEGDFGVTIVYLK
jgi:DNA mismatch repair protein MutS2